MDFYTDCDKILKIHHDYYLEESFSEDNEAKSLNFDSFLKICNSNLNTKKDGYFRAIQYTLTNDGYLKTIGEGHDILTAKHYVTPKGYTFVINGGYKKIMADQTKKSIFDNIILLSAVMGWVVASIFSYAQYRQNEDNSKKTIK